MSLQANAQSALIPEVEPKFEIYPDNPDEVVIEGTNLQTPKIDIQIEINKDKDEKQSVLTKSVAAPSRTTFTVDEKMLEKLDNIK